MNRLIYVVVAILVAGAGCWLATLLLPQGAPRLVAYVASVVAGFGLTWGGWSGGNGNKPTALR